MSKWRTGEYFNITQAVRDGEDIQIDFANGDHVKVSLADLFPEAEAIPEGDVRVDEKPWRGITIGSGDGY